MEEVRNKDEESYDGSWYKQADFPNVIDFLYCQRFCQLVWSNEVWAEESSDDEGASGQVDPAVRQERRVKAGKRLLPRSLRTNKNLLRGNVALST